MVLTPQIYFTANWANYGHVGRVLRRLTTQWKSIDVVESVGVAGKSDPKRTVKYFRLEFPIHFGNVTIFPEMGHSPFRTVVCIKLNCNAKFGLPSPAHPGLVVAEYVVPTPMDGIERN
nr:5'-nucleotidase SurE-like [Ipomoea batatas]